MKHWTFALALGAMLCAGGGAYAQSAIKNLAQQGNWSTTTYTNVYTDPTSGNSYTITDCSVSTTTHQTMFMIGTSDSGDNSFSLSNSAWSLPLHATGPVTIIVNGHTRTYQSTALETLLVNVSLTQDQLISLVWDMELASSMQVKVGSLPPLTISLDGAKTTLTAMMNWANLPNLASGTDSNDNSSSSN